MIRIALLQMTSKLRGVLTHLVAHEPDMELIDWKLQPERSSSEARPDVLICGIPDPLDSELSNRLLRSHPYARVVMVADSGDRAALYELEPVRQVFEAVSRDQVIEAIRYGGDKGDRS